VSLVKYNPSLLSLCSLKIKPSREIELHDGSRIIEFWRGEKQPTKRKPCDMAMLIVSANRKSFKMHYYPLNSNDLQIVENINIDKLGDAVNDLINAGF